MSKLKVNELDTESGTTLTVAAGKTLTVPATSTLDISAATLTPPAVMPASSAANLTNVPGANITGTIPAAALGNVDTTGLQDDIALLAFKTQANGSLARYNLVDQSVDAFEDATGVDASASTNEVRNASNYYYGEAAGTPVVSGNYDSTGTDGLYTWYKWTTVTSSGSYTTDTAQDYEYLVIAGGAAGGGAEPNDMRGGGGGAGGYRTATGFAVAATTIGSITVGAGGAAQTGSPRGNNGADSVFSTITSTGGGGGGVYSSSPPSASYGGGRDGGSGGGGGAMDGGPGPAGAGNTPSTSPVQGYAGGIGVQYAASPNASGGGGGGSSAVGIAGSGGTGGDGGAGTSSAIDGTPTVRGGGGGGGGGASPGGGGTGGGGNGAGGNASGSGGTANTGGGGGGASAEHSGNHDGGAGGSGIVIIRRLTGADVEGANMTLVSTAQTAQAQPTKGDIVVTYTNGTGTTTLDTDLIASVSRDNGTTYTAVPLTLQGTTGGHNIATGHDVVISGQPAGTSMRWKMVTANQNSASKTTRIQAVSLGWS